MALVQQASSVLTFERALNLVQEHASGLLSSHQIVAEEVSLPHSLGRVLAEEIRADRDLPAFARSTRDGYALRSLDLRNIPAKLKITARIKAGGLTREVLHIGPGEAAEIMTGAPVPCGADAVVMLEYAEEKDGTVHIQRTVSCGENIVERGREGRKGELLIAMGTRVSYPQIAMGAAVGKNALKVFRKPKIAILATGDEVVELEQTPAANEIRNANAYSLAAQVQLAGADPLQLPIAPDERKRLGELIAQGLKSDLLLMSGGVSMGKYDLVEDVLRELDAEFFFTGARIQPGSPVVFGRTRCTYFLGLPGNPLSTMVTCQLFAQPLIAALSGERNFRHSFVQAVLGKSLKVKAGLVRFLPALLVSTQLRSQVETVPWQGSGDLAAMARANCFLVVPADRQQISAGEHVTVMMRPG